MDANSDPTFGTIHAGSGISSLLKAGVVWAGNPIVTDMKSASDHAVRYTKANSPLAMYRGVQDGTMTEWGQLELQRIANSTGARVELFSIPGVGHTSLFPGGKVTNSSGAIPVLNHSFNWLSDALGVRVLP